MIRLYNYDFEEFVFTSYLPNYFPPSYDDYLYVEAAGITNPNGCYKIDRMKPLENDFEKPLYVLEYVTQGRGIIVYNGEKYTVQTGDFYLLNDRFPHCYYSDPEDPYGKLWINVSGSFIDKIIESFGFPPILICKADVGDDLSGVHELLRGKTQYDLPGIESELCVALFRLLYKVNECRKQSDGNTEVMRKMLNYINQHITDDISIGMICAENYISRSTLYRLFRQNLDLSPTEYINKVKARTACRILEKTDVDVHTIARQLGFCDYAYFSRVFSAEMGQTPVAYRKSKRQDGSERKIRKTGKNK